MGESSGPSFLLKIMVAKKENRVIMAEANIEFMEVLFSFLMMPIARVVLHTRDCVPGDIGCLNNLYASVENLELDFLKDKRYKDVLLNPRSAADIYCKNLELNLVGSGSNAIYVCDDKDCKIISYYKIGKCRCGEDLKHMITLALRSRFFPEDEGGFLKSTARFMITDDLKVMPVAMMADLTALNELGKYEKIEERVIKIGRDEVLNLLSCSLRSRTPLSDTFLRSSINISDIELVDPKHGPEGMNPSPNVKDVWKKRTNKIHLKLIFDKVDNKALYAVAKEDFVNLLCFFLTFPLGYIFNKFPSLSFEGCLGNLHNSIQETDISLFSCKERKELIVNPKLAPGLHYNSNLIGIEEANITSDSSALSSVLNARKRLMSFKARTDGNGKFYEAFLKEPATFLVMDSLEVKPLSPISVKLLVDKLMVPLSDIAEREVILDEEKAMRLLAASLTTEHALTTTFLCKKSNADCDCLDFIQLMFGGKKDCSKGY